ncbi:MAG: tetratricopeptide repeat protein [Bacteroidia bacterium]
MKTRKWRKTEKDSLAAAQAMFQDENYLLALPIFEKLEQSHPKELYLKYVFGICGLYRSDQHPKALELLSAVYEKNKKAAGIRYDLARAYHYNYKFDEALALLNEYMKDKKLTASERKDAEQLVEYCNNAKILVAAPVDTKIDNIGDIVNTVGSEYVPVVSSDESVMIYTYTGDQSVGGLQNAYNQPDSFGIYYEDVFITHKEGDNWATPGSIGNNINTNTNDAAIAISNDGQKLFIFKDNSYDGGDIYISTLDSNGWSAPEKLKGEVNTAAWEGSASLSADEKTLYFSSERPGGYGGRDLYKATKLADGTWGNIQNLGMKVNTARDDDAPFIHPDGKKLIYSSQALNSMGSYDIFMTEYNAADSSWSTPRNLGYPINTPDDDRYFVLSTDGKRGYYASGKEGGFGLHDIYIVDMPDNFITPDVIMVKGTVTLDDKPVSTMISVDMTDNNQNYRSMTTQRPFENYLVNLMSGHNYKITYKLNGFPDQVKTVDAMDLHGYSEMTFDIKFSNKIDSAALPAVKNDSIKKITPDSVATDIGNSTKEGLEFKVQIAAYNLPKNYKYGFLKGLGNVEKLLLDDGITRFTIGGAFRTLNEATAHKDKVRAAGQTDAFVTAIYKGKRVYLEDLEKLGLIPPQPK